MPDENIYTGGKNQYSVFFRSIVFLTFNAHTQSKKEKKKKLVYIYCVHSHTYTMISGNICTHLFFFLGNPQHKKYVSLLLLLLPLLYKCTIFFSIFVLLVLAGASADS